MEKEIKLPRNRKEQFAEAFNFNIGRIILCSCFVGLFLIPFVISYSYFGLVSNSIMEAIEASSNESEQLTMLGSLFLSKIIYSISLIPCLTIFLIGLAMGFQYMKSLCFDNSNNFKDSFWKSLKGVFSKTLLFSFLVSVVIALMVFTRWALLIYGIDNTGLFGIILSVIVSLIITGVTYYAFTQLTFYRLTFKQLIKNSCLLFFANFFRNVGLALLAILPILVGLLLGYVIANEIILFIYWIFGLGFVILYLTIYSQISLDKYINETNYPELMDNGLARD